MLFCAKNKRGSLTSMVVELTVVVVPETVRSPLIVREPSFAKDITSDAAPEVPSIKLILDALLSAAKVSVAITLLIEKKIDRVILSRPAVEAGEKLGFLPGDMKEKVDPYLRPLYDALYELFGSDKIDKKIESGEIEIAPLAFMRGRTLKNCFAILDEAQNATETQIKMFLTRIGENSKLVVNGDPSQVDLINKAHSGLTRSRNILKELKEIKIIEFDHTDVVRHPLVSKIIRAYQKKSTDDKS